MFLLFIMFASKITRRLRDHKHHCYFSTKQSNSFWCFSPVLPSEFALSSYPLVISRGSSEKAALLSFPNSGVHLSKRFNLNTRTYSIYLHLRDGICVFKCFSGRRVCEIPLCTGGDVSPLSPPCGAGHPRPPGSPRISCQQCQGDRTQCSCTTVNHMKWVRTWPPEAEKNKSLTEACNQESVSACWAKEKTGRHWRPLKKRFILMDVPAWSNFCLYSNSCLQTTVMFTHNGLPQQWRFFQQIQFKICFGSGSQTWAVNMKPKVKGFDLARARHTS